MVLVALVPVEILVPHNVVVIIVHNQLGLVVFGGRDDLDAAIAEELVDRAQLCISYIDILEGNLNLVLSDGTGLRAEIEQLFDGRVQRGFSALSLSWHRCSLLST